jgi:hypothetical protein
MNTLAQILFLILAIFIGWQTYRYVRVNPQAFSKANLSRSIFTLGILALILIGFIALCVVFLKSKP